MDESITKHLEQFDRQRITTLSEAIRVGARLRPQCHLKLFENGRSCALGAAYEATIGPYQEMNDFSVLYNQLANLFPFLKSTIPGIYSMLGQNIYSDNDSGMTREAIADKLEAMGY